MKLKRDRFLSLDVIRGICIILMILDHFVLMVIKFNTILSCDNLFWINLIAFCRNVINNGARKVVRYIVVSCFFIVSGISCSLSKSNFRRGIKLAIYAIAINIITYTIYWLFKFDIRVEFGVIHFYAASVLIWSIFEKLQKFAVRISFYLVLLFTSVLIFAIKPTLSTSNILLPIGIPEKGYIYQFDYFPLFPWISIFLIGGLIGENYFKTKEAKHRRVLTRLLSPLLYVGQHGLGIYIIHLPLLIILITIFYFI